MTVAPIKRIRDLISLLKKKGYIVYEQPFKLNNVSVRADVTDSNKFDDTFYSFWKNEKGQWEGRYYPITTDAGTYYLKNLMNPSGAALLKEGQYVDAWEFGKHKGLYDALVQSKPVTVYRDYDRDAILDFNNGKEETGRFGINIHKAGKNSEYVDTWSAGCQVFQNSADFEDFMKLVNRQKQMYGKYFTYTLIDERAYNRAKRRYLMYFGITALFLGVTWATYRTNISKPIIPKF